MNETRPPLSSTPPRLQPPAQGPLISPPRPAVPAAPARGPLPLQSIKPEHEDLEPIGLVEEALEEAPAVSKIKAFGVTNGGRASEYKRQPFATGRGAIRVRTFHGRLSDEGMGFMDDKINEWLDGHPEIEVKYVTTTIGQFEGKIREPALVVNVWY